MQNGILENFALPEAAVEAISRRGVREVQLDDGVQRMVMSGHDQGLAYKFVPVQVKNELKTKLAKFPVYDTVDHVQWMKSRRQKPMERVKELPPELLAFDDEGNCVGGQYAEAYERYKAGLEAPGLPLDKWGQLTDAEVQSLSEMGIFSVEQFAAQPKSKINSRFPNEYQVKHDLAVEFVAGKPTRELANAQAQEIAELRMAAAKKDLEVDELKEQMAAVMESMSGAAPKKRNRKANEVIEDE
jgi:uncharacterized coiled-coil protein SlyX